ncbi:MAG: amidohydrolase family protein [Chloroflexota bacterium]
MIDFHQHIGHFGRTVEHLLAHQEAHGVRQSVVLPLDRSLAAEDGHFPNEAALEAAQQYPDRLIPFCHVDPRHPGALDLVRRYQAAGARGYGEHKLRIPCDLPESLAIYRLCGELGLPVLLHFEYRNYNYNFEAFEQVLRAHPATVFIGHAQAWWANVSAAVPRDPDAPGYTAYPQGPVVPGGRTDRWLAAYPNLYGDLSAGSGLGALTRDPAFARDFVNRHRKKLLWATDCPCRDGQGDWGEGRRRECFAARSLPLLRELAADEDAFLDITERNARRVLRIDGETRPPA